MQQLGMESYNQSNKQVRDIELDDAIKSNIMAYRAFLSRQYSIIAAEFSGIEYVDFRIKSQASILAKIERFMNNPQINNGRSAINKCFNDLLGFRCILPHKYTMNELITLFYDTELWGHINIQDGGERNTGYKAVHIYFKSDNYNYKWEFQIWDKIDAQNNFDCHKKYKQNYTKVGYMYKTEKIEVDDEDV